MYPQINPANNQSSYGNVQASTQGFAQGAAPSTVPRLQNFAHPAQFAAAMEAHFGNSMPHVYGYLSSHANTQQGVEMFKAVINHSHMLRDYLNVANPMTSGQNQRTAKITSQHAPAALARVATHLQKDTGTTRALDYLNHLANQASLNADPAFTASMGQAVAELAGNLNCIASAGNKNKAIGIVNRYLHLLSPQMQQDFLNKVNPGGQAANASMSSASANQAPEIGNYGPATQQFVSAMEAHFGYHMESLHNHLKAVRPETSTATFKTMINGSHMLREYLGIANPMTSGQNPNAPKIAWQNAPGALARAATHLTKETGTSRALENLERLISNNDLSGPRSNPVFARSVSEAAGELAHNLKFIQGQANKDTAIRIINICRPHLSPDMQNTIHARLTAGSQATPPRRENYPHPAQFAAAMEAHFGYNMPLLNEHLKTQTPQIFADMISNSHTLRDYLHIANPGKPGYNSKTLRIHPHHAPEPVARAATHVRKHTAASRALGFLEAQVPRFLARHINDLPLRESFSRAVVELSLNLNFIAEDPMDGSHTNNQNRARAIVNSCLSYLDGNRQQTVQNNLARVSQPAAASTSASVSSVNNGPKALSEMSTNEFIEKVMPLRWDTVHFEDMHKIVDAALTSYEEGQQQQVAIGIAEFNRTYGPFVGAIPVGDKTEEALCMLDIALKQHIQEKTQAQKDAVDLLGQIERGAWDPEDIQKLAVDIGQYLYRDGWNNAGATADGFNAEYGNTILPKMNKDTTLLFTYLLEAIQQQRQG